MATVTVRFNTDEVVNDLSLMGARGHIALRRALRKTAASVGVLMGREVARDTGLRVGTVRDEVKVRMSDHEAVATISISGARIPLIDFHARGPEPSKGKGRGVTARIQGQQRRYSNAFIATTRSGHRGVFKRQGLSARKSAGAWSKNLPIVQLHGPSLPHVFAKYLPLGVQRAEEQLGKNLEHELSFALSQE